MMKVSTQNKLLVGLIVIQVITLNVQGTCVDNVACPLYAKEICTDSQYLQWATTNCPKFCGFCKNGETTQANGVGKFMDQSNAMDTCKDAISNCADYGTTICSDVKFYTWTSENCKAHCNRCSVPCEDKVTNCADYGTTLCTELSYYNWVEMNCRRYCARCT